MTKGSEKELEVLIENLEEKKKKKGCGSSYVFLFPVEAPQKVHF